MNTAFKKAFEHKVIYVFTVDDEAHRGLVKIGDATLHTDTPIDALPPNCKELNQAALTRIRSYTNTAGLTPKLLHTEVAVRSVPDKDSGGLLLKAFRDHDVHTVLRNSGIEKVQIGESTGKEWFEIDVETAKKAIAAVKQNFSNLSNTDIVKQTPIIFRPEQADCITKVVNHFKKADRFLINAKMRYGKTFVSLEIVKQCKFEKTIILTHRPVVNAGWYEDFTKIFYGYDDYIYGSKANGETLEALLSSGKKFVYFASVQDLRGSSQVGGKFEKNDIIFDTIWDCVIVDEAHEGTTTALGEDTVKAVVKEGNGKTKFLALSGTPFNILDDYDESSIYTWDYIMEQENKSEWDKLHFGDSNPYEELPELRIYTYSLGDILHNSNYITFEDKAFNFHEFFRTWTGDFKADYADMPVGAETGDFVHEADVWSFLNLMATKSDDSCYPYSTEEYRALFKHSLWMVPGVKEARALKKLMLKHPVFGNGMFDIVNVAGSGDEEEKAEEALSKVRKAIKSAGDNYTITLSCGKLTTGVTVKEWTAVFMLAGSFSTSAANYLQTIFRVQSPCNEDGKIKNTAYVFDFAPDRTLKMVSQAVSVSSKAGKTKIGDKQIMGKFLNYCPVIAVSGSQMQEYSATKLLQQLKKAYAEKVVRNGFDDTNLYNDELFKLQDVDIKKFDDLKGIIGASKAAPKAKDITVNNQGLTNEEYEETERLKKKKKAELSPEEKARLEELKKMKKLRNDAISILRGISIRMPLLIYGADIPYDEEITLDKFVDMVDQSSWDEFMPNGVTKEKFREFQKYYDEEVFIAAGRHIRNVAREADTLAPTERVKKIASLFSTFKNPDKETVLTPWRVVNMHLSDCIGGWDFWDEEHKEMLDEPRFVDRGKVTADIFDKQDTHILEINSKTGLYPLYVTYSVFREKCKTVAPEKLTLEKQREIWRQVISDNIFVICKTPMAKTITQRTLLGYSGGKINAHYFEDLINTMQNKPQQFVDKVLRENYWKMGDGKMRIDAIVGNPPYQQSTSDSSRQAKPIYNLFIQQAMKMQPTYLSMITPSRWFAGGMGLDGFREEMMQTKEISKMVDFVNAKDCFPQISISGGVCYFLYDHHHSGVCEFSNVFNGERDTLNRPLNEFPVLVRYNKAVSILHKIAEQKEASVSSMVSPISPFGLPTSVRGSDSPTSGENIKLISSKGVSYIEKSFIKEDNPYFDAFKVLVSQTSAEHAGEPSKDGSYRVLTSSMTILKAGEVCTHSYILLGPIKTFKEAKNVFGYLRTKFARFLILLALSSIHISRSTFVFVPMQNFEESWDDKKLYEKYGLSEDEIAFIERTIKPMEIENDISSSVSEISAGGWVFYVGEDAASLGDKCGKWMYFFNGRPFAEKICRQAVEQGVVTESKHSDADNGVCCFYINGDDAAAHQRLIQFLLDNDLIRKKKDGGLYNISFKFDTQTRAGEYGEEFDSHIKLDQFVDLNTGKMLEHPTFQPEDL